MNINFPVILVASVVFGAYAAKADSHSAGLAFVADCELNQECFVQQGPDVSSGKDVSDPACGYATYDGHKGWDIRLRSLADINNSVPVVAAADGVVSRVRDGMADILVQSDSEMQELKGRECGNGIFIEHADSIQTQYCHLKSQSIDVTPGDVVKKGQPIAAIGASGLATFPHVHLAVFRNGKVIEPLTGAELHDVNLSCGDFSNSLLDDHARSAFAAPKFAFLGIGLSDQVPELPVLLESGFPPTVKNGSEAVIAWAWSINLEKGWRIRLKVVDPNSRVFSEWTSEPLSSRKANYVAYSGRRIGALPGRYVLSVDILAGEQVLDSSELSIMVE